MADLASNYASACRETNDRLRRCGDYLRRGLRSEAIQLAECHPNLLETVATLDLGELEQWEQLCAGYDMPRPERMMMEVAQVLNQAYVQEQAIHDLLVKHRTLALSRAPLRDRIAVLRELTAADPQTAFWSEDQAAVERATFPALRAEVAAALKARDAAAIIRLSTATDPSLWRADVPADVVQALQRANDAARSELAVAELTALIPKVRAALQAGSYPEAKRVQAKWDKVVATQKVEVPPELVDELIPLETWVAEQERQSELQAEHESACATLHAMLKENVGEDDLLARYQAITATGLPCSPDLEAAFQQKLKRRAKAKRLEQITLIAVVAVVVLITIAVIVMIAAKTGHR